MINTEILQDIITDHELCAVQKRELLKVMAMIKQNRLIELPCAVGDTVWIVRGNVYEAKVCRIVSHIPASNDYITLDVVYEHIDFFYNDGRTTKDTAICRYLSDAFLTKEEAEAKLAEKGDVNE